MILGCLILGNSISAETAKYQSLNGYMLLCMHPNALRRQTISQFWFLMMSIERCLFLLQKVGETFWRHRKAVLTQIVSLLAFRYLCGFAVLKLKIGQGYKQIGQCPQFHECFKGFSKHLTRSACCRVANKSYSYLKALGERRSWQILGDFDSCFAAKVWSDLCCQNAQAPPWPSRFVWKWLQLCQEK